MMNIFCIFIFAFLFAVVFTKDARADTFETLIYTPPTGWTKQTSSEKTTYQRNSGIGAIVFYASYPTNDSAANEFAKMWREKLEPTLAVKAPQPQIQKDGNWRAAIGAQTVNAQGTMTNAVLTAFVGQGKAICVLSLSAGGDAMREVTAFLDSIKISPETPQTQTNSNSASTDAIEVDFEVPPGYIARRSGQIIELIPAQFTEKTPCAYGIIPSRPSKGNLETDARAAILETLPGWRVKSDYYNAMRGISADGWEFYWFFTDVQSGEIVNGSYQNLSAMTMAFPAGSGRTNIVWGIGENGRCRLDDLAFAQLFHSLRPRGWTSDAAKFRRELLGTWRDVQTRGVAQYKFFADGRYEYGVRTITQFGTLETTTSNIKNGRFELRGGELILTTERGEISKFKVRIYDHYNTGGWKRAMSILKGSGGDALDVQYFRIED